MSSPASPAKLPVRKRRGSSEEFGPGSLGSIGVESSVQSGDQKPKARSDSHSFSLPSNVESVIASRPHGKSVDSSLGGEGPSSATGGSSKRRRKASSADLTSGADSSAVSRKLSTADTLPAIDSLPSNLEGASSPVGKRRSDSQASSQPNGEALEHLDALGQEAGAAAALVQIPERHRKESISESSGGTFGTNNQRLLLETFMQFDEEKQMRRRDRLESWGGMSDISMGGGVEGNSSLAGNSGTATAAALAASALHFSNSEAAAHQGDGESVSSFLNDGKQRAVPPKIAFKRDRLNSIFSTGGSSLADPTFGVGDHELSSDLQAFVSRAMASVGDQLAEIANSVELANDDPVLAALGTDGHMSESSSIVSGTPIIGATSDQMTRARSSSVSSALNISVDYDAVAAAVDAATAATDTLGIGAIGGKSSSDQKSKKDTASSKARRSLPTKKRKLPLNRDRAGGAKTPPKSVAFPPIPESKMNERDLEKIREQARAAAGYVAPASGAEVKQFQPPPKKRVKYDSIVQSPAVHGKPNENLSTPKVSNTAATATPMSVYSSFSTPGSFKSTASSKGQSSQKWDSMFDCLLDFIKERKKEDFETLNEDEKKAWVWDGNVPTTYKTDDGKALGRWVNNQRSAKSKGTLKADRERRLVDAGLKWSVLASNSWNEMLEELRLYVNDQLKQGRKWDGNVPTNYRIKTKSALFKTDDDKNLGRWVNRQRSLYQSGRLRKDRQVALEQLGLKWSMLATTSWDSMYETLCDYVAERTKDGSEWDGNVPANYRTADNPPRALGRWINRQRSAYQKDKLKPDAKEKLTKLGLKWAVHERRSMEEILGPDYVPSVSTGATGAVPDAVSSSSSGPSNGTPVTSKDETTEAKAGGSPSDASTNSTVSVSNVTKKLDAAASDQNQAAPKPEVTIQAASTENEKVNTPTTGPVGNGKSAQVEPTSPTPAAPAENGKKIEDTVKSDGSAPKALGGATTNENADKSQENPKGAKEETSLPAGDSGPAKKEVGKLDQPRKTRSKNNGGNAVATTPRRSTRSK